jgi:hypothetical protein
LKAEVALHSQGEDLLVDELKVAKAELAKTLSDYTASVKSLETLTKANTKLADEHVKERTRRKSSEVANEALLTRAEGRFQPSSAVCSITPISRPRPRSRTSLALSLASALPCGLFGTHDKFAHLLSNRRSFGASFAG